MKVSELIEALQEILQVDGNYSVHMAYVNSMHEDEDIEIEDIRIDKSTKIIYLE